MRKIRQNLSHLELANVIIQDARGAALLVADAVERTLACGHWSQADPMREPARATAAQIRAMDEAIGPVCERSLSETVVAAMAESAHALVRAARDAAACGRALIWCDDDTVLVDVKLEAALIPAYAVVIG